MSSYRLARIALLSSLGFVGRIIFLSLPNIQPLSVIIILVSRRLPVIDSLCIAIFSMILSNILLGMGPWTIFQIVAYSLIVLFVSGLEKVGVVSKSARLERIYWSILSGGCGYLYGFIMSILWFWISQSTLFWPYWIGGLFFDSLHAGGNLIFYLILAPYLLPKLENVKSYF